MPKLTGALGLLLGLWMGGTAQAGTLTVEMLDVGQGDSILITSPAGKTILIDAGIKKADVVGQLRQRGVDHLDLVVGTHPHADHIGGMAEVLTAFPVKVYTDNGLAHTTKTYEAVMDAVEEKGIAYRPGLQGQSFKLDDGILVEVLHPEESKLTGTRSDLNSNSVVMRLTHGENCFLFTGDAEEPTEFAVLRDGQGQCDVLKVAHHGSGHSSSAAWLRTVQPTLALISCGVDNRYGHPDPEALERLESAGAEVYRTDTMGAIVVESDGQELTVTTKGKTGDAPTPPARMTSAPGRTGSATGLTPASPGARAQAAESPATESPTAAPARPTPAALKPAGPPTVPAPVQAGLPADCGFVASRSSKVFHPAGCHVVDRIWEGNRVCFATAAAAEASGRTRSQACPEL